MGPGVTVDQSTLAAEVIASSAVPAVGGTAQQVLRASPNAFRPDAIAVKDRRCGQRAIDDGQEARTGKESPSIAAGSLNRVLAKPGLRRWCCPSGKFFWNRPPPGHRDPASPTPRTASPRTASGRSRERSSFGGVQWLSICPRSRKSSPNWRTSPPRPTPWSPPSTRAPRSSR